jgi:hypothetical protein
MIYTIAGGVGKTRMNADASLRDTYTWSTFAVLSCECSLQEKVRSDGGEWLAGMAVRIVDIDVTGVDREIDAETLHSIGEIERHYGHAGPAFVQALIEHGIHNQAAALRDRVLNGARALAGQDNTDSAVIRAAMPLSLLLIAGTFAKSFSLIPPNTPITEAVKWAWGRFTLSSEAAPLDPETQIVHHLHSWIAERWGVTIKSVDAENGINNRETVAWFDETAIYIPKDRLREAAGNTLRESQVAAILDRRGMIARKTEADRLYVRFIPKVGRVASYALSRAEFGRPTHSAEPNMFMVHRGGRDD